MSIAAKIGCTTQTLNDWVKKTEVDSGRRAGIPTELSERMKALERDNREKRQANEILRKASAYFAMAGSTAGRSDGGFHRRASGCARGEPICGALPIAPSTYYDHLAKRADPSRLSDRARRDEALRPEIRRVFEDNWSVYGMRKVWHQLRRECFDVARSTVGRLMKDMDIQGIIRGKPHKTTIPDKKQLCPRDKVNRQFRVPAPTMLWVSDFTFVAT
jgi:hypothetical protein